MTELSYLHQLTESIETSGFSYFIKVFKKKHPRKDMGSQQLLLIGLSVIVVGLMILAGISIYKAYTESSNRDQIIANMQDLGIMAQAYSKKNDVLGGGGGNFTGWNIPPELRNTNAGSFTARVRASRVNLTCDGKYTGLNGTTLIRVSARVDNNEIRITIVN